MSVPESEYKVYIYMNDYHTLCAEVYRHQQIETGGNLFGLWTTSGSAVIHVVLGPGKYCRRTDTSFHQDIAYLKRVGSFVNQKYMLCHIGEWHSHHCLSLSKPSRGDELTIERNFPSGMTKFLVIIANIKDGDQILLSPYFFTHDGTRYEKAVVQVLESDSPFSCNDKIMKEIALGSERKETSLSATAGHVATASNDAKNLLNMGSNSQREGATGATHPQATKTNNHPSSDDVTSMETSDWVTPVVCTPSSTDNALSQVNTSQSDESIAAQNHTVNGEDNQASKKDVILKEINDVLEKFFSKDGEVHINRNTSSGEIKMEFEHNVYHWMIRFPDLFPNEPAQLFKRFPSSSANSWLSTSFLVQPLTNCVNIFLSIKKDCLCTICGNISKENLASSAIIASTSGNTKLDVVVKALTIEIELTLANLFSLNVKTENDGSCIMQFEHNYYKWVIYLPIEFPVKAAEIQKHENRYGALQAKVINSLSNNRHEQTSLNSPKLIILAIKNNCRCVKCKPY